MCFKAKRGPDHFDHPELLLVRRAVALEIRGKAGETTKGHFFSRSRGKSHEVIEGNVISGQWACKWRGTKGTMARFKERKDG